jgi:hydroxyethylthiazole kinase
MNIGRSLQLIRERKPLIHQITNYVVMNETANATLALGALPVMAHAIEEVEEFAAVADAVVLNIGTLSTPWVDAMLLAGIVANQKGIPVVLDPVGAGATRFRTETSLRILDQVDVAVLCGNAAECASLVGIETKIRGVESQGVEGNLDELARAAALKFDVIASMSGPTDHISDGAHSVSVSNGHPMLASITGTGCMSSAITACFLSVSNSSFEGALAARVAFGVAGEDAAAKANGPGSFHVLLYDAIAALDPHTLDARAKFS